MSQQTTVVKPDFSKVRGGPASADVSAPKQMITVEYDGAQCLVRINSSSLSVIQTCLRKAKYSLHDRWRSRTAALPLIFGLAVHKALEVFYTYPGSERTLPRDFDDVLPLLADGHEPPEQNFLYDAALAFVRAGEQLRMLPDTDKRSLQSGLWMLGCYFKTYLNDIYVIHRDEHGPVVERGFSTELLDSADMRIELFGTIDFVLRNVATGELLPGDHKTTSMLGGDFLNRIRPNHQYTGYLIGAQRALGLTTSNFLVNGLQVKSRPLTKRGGPPNFTRQITTRTEEDFLEFKQAVVFACTNYVTASEEDVWPLGHVDACANYGGCPYLDVCSAPNQLRSNILEAKFNREPEERV